MSEARKSRKIEESMTKESQDDQDLGEYATLIMEQIKNENDSVDPFVLYTHHLRSKLYADPEKARKRLIQGYNALLLEYRKELKNRHLG